MLRVILNILVRNASPRGLMCCRCLIFGLSDPCELLFSVCETIRIFLGVVVIFLLNVMELFSVLEVLSWINHVCVCVVPAIQG